MLQITNANTAQSVYLKLDNYGSGPVRLKFTNQYSGQTFDFIGTVVTNNDRYQQINITPPGGTNAMQEGLYLVVVENWAQTAVCASRLAFVASVPAFNEATYTTYTAGDTDAYKVYTP